MMKLKIKKILLLLLVVCLGMMYGTNHAEAAEKKSMFLKCEDIKISYYTGKTTNHQYSIINENYKGAKLISAKVANSKIADAYVSISGDLFIKAYKVGTTTIQLTAKSGKKTEKWNVKLVIYKYSNPAASYKIGSKQYKSKFNKKDGISETNWKKNKNVKVQIKAKAGYRISSITYYYYNSKKEWKSVSVKNGGKVKIRGKGSSIQVNFYDEKRKTIDNLCVWFY